MPRIVYDQMLEFGERIVEISISTNNKSWLTNIYSHSSMNCLVINESIVSNKELALLILN